MLVLHFPRIQVIHELRLYSDVLKRVRVTMTCPGIGKSRTLIQNGSKMTNLRSLFHHPHFNTGMKAGDHCFTHFCVCRRASKLILPFLVVGLAFTAGLAAFMPVIP